MSRWGMLTFGGLCGACILVLGGEIRWTRSRFDPEAIGVATSTRTGQPGLPAAMPVAKSSVDLAAVMARPLFNWQRRPGLAEAVPHAEDGLPRLSGIVISPAGRYAIFAATAGHRATIMQEGGKIGHFTIDRIAADHVDIVSDTGARSLHPSFDALPPPPPVRIPVDL